MQALVKVKPEPGLVCSDIDAPEVARPDDVLFEVSTCAICTGELKVYEWGAWAAADTTIALPTVLGHEAAGVVRAVGSEVTGVTVGDRVVVDPIIGCGHCEHCRAGYHNMCPDREIYGKRRGAMAEFAVLPERAICKMPDGMSMEEGALLENLGIAVHAVEDFGHDPGNLAVVIGAGPIGIMAAQTLVAWGLRVLISDLVPSRVEMARAISGANVVDAAEDDLGEVVTEVSSGLGADFVLEAAATQSALDLALDIVKPRGTVVTIGTFDGDVSFNPFFKMTRKEIRLQSRMGRSWETWRRMTQLVRDGRVNLAPLASESYDLGDYEKAFDRARSPDIMKVLFNCES
jgi:2-desacetyl-2-hydroxyethyl bacteriochlorophyllide A dehydrogenase